MHPNIKTFSDSLAIDPRLEVTITVQIHGFIVGRVDFNGTRCYAGVNHFQIDLLDDLELISTIDKYVEGSSAIEITEFTVNGYNVIPLYQHLSSSGNAYHDWVGEWQMSIPAPFYYWYHCASGQGWVA
jgi:hypothetical protein